MSKQLFVIVLVALVLGLAGWMVYVSSQEVQAEPVQAISSKWGDSEHADRTAEAFVHWDEDEPPEIPSFCAQCHSTYGYLDFLGEDGTAAGVVDNAALTGTVVSCQVCHNDSAHSLSVAVYPSGDEITGLGMEANCMECHQGRSSNVQVREAIASLPLDQVSEDLGFINVHYFIPASSRMGAETQGGYQYDGKTYVTRFLHAEGARSCLDCHDPHALRVNVDNCAVCHSNVADYGDIRNVRVSDQDYDGDGNTTEGVADEIKALQEKLYEAIKAYAAEDLEAPLVYGVGSYPYFFLDTNADGEAGEDETIFPNQYTVWTPRLVRTTYNYHYTLQDSSAYSHNPKYAIQLLHDSLADLAEVVSVDMDGMVRP